MPKITIGGTMSFLSTLAQYGGDYDSLYGESYQMTQQNVQASDAAVAALAVGTIIFAIIITVVAYVLNAFLLGRIFKKAGVEQWKAWVPVYNSWVMLELGDQKGWWAVLMLVPFVNIVALVFLIIAEYNIGLKLGKEGVFVLLAIFLPLVWLIWLAFDKSTWKGAKPAVVATEAAPVKPEATETKPPVPPQAPVA